MKILQRIPYWYLLVVPILLFGLGAASNQAVLIANHRKFPVMLSDARYEMQCPQDLEKGELESIPAASCVKGGDMIDPIHSVMGPNSHLKVLSDIFPLGNAIYSIGDGFLFLAEWLLSFTPIMWIALAVRKLFVTS